VRDIPAGSNRSGDDTHGFPGIESDAETCGGSPRIAGTRVTVGTIMARYRVHAGSIQAILVDYPLLDETQVRSAMDYYSLYSQEIDAQEEANRRYCEEQSNLWLERMKARR
jgi:uncharacterized protein (DUF433 family)